MLHLAVDGFWLLCFFLNKVMEGMVFFVLLTEPTCNGNSYVLKSDYLFINHCFMVYSYSLEYC